MGVVLINWGFTGVSSICMGWRSLRGGWGVPAFVIGPISFSVGRGACWVGRCLLGPLLAVPWLCSGLRRSWRIFFAVGSAVAVLPRSPRWAGGRGSPVCFRCSGAVGLLPRAAGVGRWGVVGGWLPSVRVVWVGVRWSGFFLRLRGSCRCCSFPALGGVGGGFFWAWGGVFGVSVVGVGGVRVWFPFLVLGGVRCVGLGWGVLGLGSWWVGWGGGFLGWGGFGWVGCFPAVVGLCGGGGRKGKDECGLAFRSGYNAGGSGFRAAPL